MCVWTCGFETVPASIWAERCLLTRPVRSLRFPGLGCSVVHGVQHCIVTIRLGRSEQLLKTPGTHLMCGGRLRSCPLDTCEAALAQKSSDHAPQPATTWSTSVTCRRSCWACTRVRPEHILLACRVRQPQIQGRFQASDAMQPIHLSGLVAS